LQPGLKIYQKSGEQETKERLGGNKKGEGGLKSIPKEKEDFQRRSSIIYLKRD